MIPDLFMVFDVESVGLHGEGFAVGWVVLNRAGKVLGHGKYACHPDDAKGTDEGRRWVAENIKLDNYPMRGGFTPVMVRREFWLAWQEWRKQGAVMVSDCGWPVEARFLAACVDDDPKSREWEGPYPLHDLASIRLANGLDPLATLDRHMNELPVHDPLADARQSARLFVEMFTV